jgi:pimeloyl-ACP methyl ester carboxylesterase
MTNSNYAQQIMLKDGRKLGYAEYGATKGKPIIYFHGFPGSRLDLPLCVPNDIATGLNARIIAIDRPGIGLSDFKSKRAFLDWPDDVLELADELSLDRFSVLGMSGGGPYAVVCAYMIPERLTSVGIVSGMGPANAPGIKQGACWIIPKKPSWLRKPFLFLMDVGVRKAPERVIANSLDMLPEPDKIVLDDPELSKVYIDCIQESFRSGTSGVNYEAGMYTRPWGYQLRDIEAPIHIWHGELDRNVPISVGRYYSENVPKCEATFFDNEGHLSIFRNHTVQILSVLLE